MQKEEAAIFRQTVSEADIDWLFCVELNASDDFRKWIASKLFQDVDEFEHIQAWRSVANVVGESDLIWLIDSPEHGRIMALIENKIDAVAQPEQYQRYVRRGEGYMREGLCMQYLVALISPKQYSSHDSKSYPLQISYEDILGWLKEYHDERSKYLALIYELAINKLGNLAPVDDDITKFREQIWQFAKDEFPELTVPDPKGVSATQTWVYMRYPGYTIIYKMYKTSGKYTNCVVDLELAGRSNDTELLQREYANNLAGTEIAIKKTGKSASFRLSVPAVVPPIFEEGKVREALQAASFLRRWWDETNGIKQSVK